MLLVSQGPLGSVFENMLPGTRAATLAKKKDFGSQGLQTSNPSSSEQSESSFDLDSPPAFPEAYLNQDSGLQNIEEMLGLLGLMKLISPSLFYA